MEEGERAKRRVEKKGNGVLRLRGWEKEVQTCPDSCCFVETLLEKRQEAVGAEERWLLQRTAGPR